MYQVGRFCLCVPTLDGADICILIIVCSNLLLSYQSLLRFGIGYNQPGAVGLVQIFLF